MRIVRILFSLFLVVFGFIAALFLLLFSRLFSRSRSRPVVNMRFNRTGQRPAPSPHAKGDVIDIEATPVKE